MKLKTLEEIKIIGRKNFSEHDKFIVETVNTAFKKVLKQEATKWWNNMEELEYEHAKSVITGKHTIHDKRDFGQWLLWRLFNLTEEDLK